MMSLCRFCCCFVFMSTSLTIGLFLRLTMCDWEWIMGSKNVCTVVCVCVHNLLAAYTVLYAYLHCIHLCVGQWVCVCDCMYVTAGVRERERERDHTDTVQLHCYIIMIMCSHYYVLSALFVIHDTGGEITFLLLFFHFISEAVACIQKAIEIYTDMVRKNTLSPLQTPTLAFWHSSSKLCYSWLCY